MKQELTQNALNKSSKGSMGEQVALQYFCSRGYVLVQANYWKKWGEIDLILKKGSRIHFVEVKAVSYETKEELLQSVTHETWRPEELVHARKLQKLKKTIETWALEHKNDGEWQIDVIAVRMVPRETFATVNLIENVIIEDQLA